jgi:signal transduction histidine kinase
VQEATNWSQKDALEDAGADEPAAPLELEKSAARILLVDDNADLRAYVSGLLRRGGFSHVELAADGLVALEAARLRPPDLVLSDIMMPRMDGFTLVHELRKDDRTSAVPIILLSARAGEEPAVEALYGGADDYLVKPFSARELLARVQTQLERVAARRRLVAHQTREAVLEESLRARDEFLMLASHELRTPVTALALQMSMLSAEKIGSLSSEQLLDKTDKLRSRVERLTKLVTELADVSELVAGPMRMQLADVQVAALLVSFVDAQQEKAKRASCDLTLSLGSQRATLLRCDPVRLEQALDALLNNAIKFARGQPVEISLSSGDNTLSIAVIDHGPGVAPSALERLGERFARGGTAYHHSGLGLGLWLVRQIADAHGGSLEVSETIGGGATFTLTMPRNDGQNTIL